VPRTAKVFLGIALAGLFLLVGAGWYFLPAFNFGVNTDSPSRNDIETVGRFKLPASAHDIRSHLEHFQDSALWVVFAMSPADEASLWQSSLCSAVSKDATGEFYMQGIDKPWWHSGKPKAFEFREKNSMHGRHVSQRILIDRTSAQELSVYIEVLES